MANMQNAGLVFVPHPTWGYTTNPNASGEVLGVTHDGYSRRYKLTSDSEGRRSTGDHRQDDDLPGDIFIFGCSFTYGWFLSDEETYPHLLQDELVGHRIVNFAQCGFGTIQAVIQLREQLRRGVVPKACVFGYLPTMTAPSGHPDRNVANPLNLRDICGQVEFADHLRDLSFTRASLASDGGLDVTFVPLDARSIRGVDERLIVVDQTYMHLVTIKLMENIIDLGEEFGFKPIFLKMLPDDRDPCLRHIEQSRNALVIDAVLPVLENAQYRVSPGDIHPNAQGHAIYAKKVIGPIREALG